MEDGYGTSTPISYGTYLRVAELISLQRCLSDPAHHDELLFITIHQTYELWFKQILHELGACRAQMDDDRPLAAARSLERIVEIEKLLYRQIHLLETMTPGSFLRFRDHLKPASGFQSTQFREIEFVSGLKDDAILHAFADDPHAQARLRARRDEPTLGDGFFALLRRRRFDAPADDPRLGPTEREARYNRRVAATVEVLSHTEALAAEFALAERLIEHDEYFSLWRLHHVKMVERMVGAKRGTGGSAGAGYLRTTVEKRFFPELWDARTQLDAAHDGDHCPALLGVLADAGRADDGDEG